jgi:hypothetical protein
MKQKNEREQNNFTNLSHAECINLGTSHIQENEKE